MKFQKFGAKSVTADTELFRPNWASSSTRWARHLNRRPKAPHQGALNKPGVLKHLWVSRYQHRYECNVCILMFTNVDGMKDLWCSSTV